MQQDCKDTLSSVTFWDSMIGAAPGGTLATIYAHLEGNGPKLPKFDIDPCIRIFKPSLSGTSKDNPDNTAMSTIVITKSQHKSQSNNPILIEESTSPWEASIDDVKATKRWTMPFIMAGINYNVVRWSYALLEQQRHRQAFQAKRTSSTSLNSDATMFATVSPLLQYKEVCLAPNFQTAFTSY
jgi:hypothetical protein